MGDSVTDTILSNPVLPSDVPRTEGGNVVVPGNIRRPEHFLCMLKLVVSFMLHRLKIIDTKPTGGATGAAQGTTTAVVPESVRLTPLDFMLQLTEKTALNVAEDNPFLR